MMLSMVLILVVVVLTSSLGLYILAGRNSQAGTPSWCEGGVLLQGTVKFYLSLLGSNSGHDARHRRHTGLILQALQTSQVLSFRETLYSIGIGEIGDNLLPRDLRQQEQNREVVGEMKERTKRFHNNINAKTLKSLEELATATAAMHNIIRPV